MANISLTNVWTVSIVPASKGLGTYNPNSIRIFTKDPLLTGSGSDDIVETQYKSLADVATDYGTTSNTYKLAAAMFAQSINFIGANGYLMITPMLNAETYTEAIIRAEALQYCLGYCFTDILTSANQVEYKAAATTIQALNHMLFVVSKDISLMTSGFFKDIFDGSLNQTKGLIYTKDDDSALGFLGGYMGRGLSTNFNGSLTCSTMNLKDISGIVGDTGITQTLYNLAQDTGVDLYVNYEGLPKVVSNSNGAFFDSIYNRLWFKLSMIVAGFNVLATIRTKIPQTEVGMDMLKAALRKICDKAVFNGFLAAGTWNSSDSIGNKADMLRNISETAYYIYSAPITQQTQEEREARIAPLVQIAIKEAGAIHSGSCIIYVEA